MPKLSAQQLINHLDTHLLAVENALNLSPLENTTLREQLNTVKARLQQAKVELQQHPSQMLVRETKCQLLDQSLALADAMLDANVINEALHSPFTLLEHRAFADMLLENVDYMRAAHINHQDAIRVLFGQCSNFVATYFANEENADLLQLTDHTNVTLLSEHLDALSHHYRELIDELSDAGVSPPLISIYRYILTHETPPVVGPNQPGAYAAYGLPGQTTTYYVDPARVTVNHANSLLYIPPVVAADMTANSVFQFLNRHSVNLGAWLHNFSFSRDRH